MGMSLANAIDKLGDDDIFYVGSKTSFFFIGNKAEWERDKEQVECWCHDFTINAEEEARVGWEKLIYLGLPRRIDYDSYEDWYQHSMQAVKVLSTAQNRLTDSIKAVKSYKPVLTRGVMESYKRDIPGEQCGTVFIVSGVETGKYWFYNEYLNKTVEESVDVS